MMFTVLFHIGKVYSWIMPTNDTKVIASACLLVALGILTLWWSAKVREFARVGTAQGSRHSARSGAARGSRHSGEGSQKDAVAPTSSMRTAVIENNAAKLKALLASGESMNEKDEASGDTLLHLAVRWGSLAAASLLLECGADVNAANGSECTPLHYAAKARAGDESEDEDEDDGWVIPERACRCEQLAELLLASRADVNAVDKSQRTPLHLAIVRKDVHAEALTRRLLQAHADPSYRYKQQTCLHLAVLEANEALVTALFLVAEAATAAGAVAGATDACQQAMLDAPGRDGWTALGLAVRCGHVSIVKGLLDLRASPLANARSGKTALEIAVANNRPGILALLVVRGVS